MTATQLTIACLLLGACATTTPPTPHLYSDGTRSEEDRGVRARDLGIPFDGTPGTGNAITDVPGVLVGHSTIIEGEGEQAVRTGVTAILASEVVRPVFASTYRLNGDGELTGTHFIDEKGYLISPILLTGTASVGTVHEAVLRWSLTSERARYPINLPVVGETWDGDLNDLYGLHVTADHVAAALNEAATGPVAEGNVGGGTGMFAHGFKAGIGTSSRRLPEPLGGFMLGVLVQANYGMRAELTIAGVPVGKEIVDRLPELHTEPSGDGSIIVVIGTDAPLLPHQLQRVARRIPMGLARCGSHASTYSGDLFIAFSTAGYKGDDDDLLLSAEYLSDENIDAVFLATVQAVEEAVVNSLIAAETMVGVNGSRVHAIPHDELREVLRRYNRLEKP